MDFIHRLVYQDQKTKIIDKKLKTWTDQLTKHPHTNHTRTKLQTKEQQTWTHTYINTWSQKTQVAKNDTPTHKSQSQKNQNTNTEQQIWKNTRAHIHTDTDLEHTRDNKRTQHFGNRFCFRLQVKTCKGDLLSYKYPRSGWTTGDIGENCNNKWEKHNWIVLFPQDNRPNSNQCEATDCCIFKSYS
jgi:hypothetical protein